MTRHRRARDALRGFDLAGVQVPLLVCDTGRWAPEWQIYKFRDPKGRVAKAGRAGLSIEELVRQFDSLEARLSILGNLLLNSGINELWSLVAGTGAVKFDATNASLGVGDSSTAEAATQTNLQAATNKTYVAMDSGYPTYNSSQLATWRGTFTTGQANYVWNEIVANNKTDGTGKSLNRKVSSMGTKTSAASWIATLQITLS